MPVKGGMFTKIAHPWGVIPKHRKILKSKYEEDFFMLIRTFIHVLSVQKQNYTDREGNIRDSFRVTFSQDNDNIVGTIVVREDLYNSVERGKDYELFGEYRTTKSGSYIVWTSAKLASSVAKTTL